MLLLGVGNPQNIINVGDTPSDIQSGFGANCRLSLAVTNGTHTKEQLAPHHPSELIGSLHDIIPIIEGIQNSKH
jgi:phosphoglycolate phosphatase-like HAD superfamily hydrolase